MSRLDGLEELAELRATGQITETEFSERKQKLLSHAPPFVVPYQNSRHAIFASVAIAAAVFAATIWITGAYKNLLPAALNTGTLARDGLASPPIDPDADVWEASLEETREGQVCAIKDKGGAPGESNEFDFYTESDDGLTEFYFAGPEIETSSDGSDTVEVTLKFTKGDEKASESKVVFKGLGTIQTASQKVQSLGAAPIGSGYVGINGGTAFYEAIKNSEYLNYINSRGDMFYLRLFGRNDLVNELTQCLKRTKGVKGRGRKL